jgi:5-methylcytosine-specific restriction endonuclease McrA
MYVLDTRDKRKKNNMRFGGLRQLVMERDKFSCHGCGMTQQEHIDKWCKSLTIDHINGVGRNALVPDNTLDNLITLCLRCHGKKDGLRTASNQYGKF